MKIKIIREETLEGLEAEINKWIERNPKIEILTGNVHYHRDWLYCHAVLWYKEKIDTEEEGWERTE